MSGQFLGQQDHGVIVCRFTHVQAFLAYEEVDKTTTNDSSISVGDTTITLTSGTGFNVGDIINFGKMEDTNTELLIDTNDITFVRHSGTGGLHNALGGGTQVRRWRYYRSVDRAFTSFSDSARSDQVMKVM